MNLIKLLFTLCGICFCIGLCAQTNGSHRNSIDWKVLKTEGANIIFAPEMEAKANRVANIVEYMRENNSLSIGTKQEKIDILIRNETIVPNGYVGLGPFRSEFFATPPDRFNRIGATDWIEHLTIHEYRHVMQAANEKVGITKLAYFFTGESGWNGMKFLSIPTWASEGDAVVMETTLTKSGRGRMPYFTRGLRALALENTDFNYSKWRNGSYDELIPNQYPFGYMLLTHLRNEKGSEVSGDIIRSGASYEKIIYPYSRSMKSKTGWNTRTLYKDAWSHFGDQWRKEVESLNLTPTQKITQNPKVVTDYFFPQYGKNGEIIALKSSFNQTERIVKVDGLLDTDITTLGFSYADYFHLQDNILTWTEYRQNARRSNTQYNNIYTLNLKTSKKTQLTKKGKYFSPSLSSDTKRIVAVHIQTDLVNTIHILDTEKGEIQAKLAVEGGATITRPIFLQGDNSIAYIIKNNNYIWIEKVDLKTQQTTALTPKSSHVIDAISTHEEYVYCSASFTGIDNIFKIPEDGSQTIEQVTSVPIGAYEPCVSKDGKTLLFTEYTTKGQMVSSMSLPNNRKGNMIDLIEPVDMYWMDKRSAQEEGGEIVSKIPNKSFKKQDYKGLFKGLKLHSWGFSPNSAEPELGIQFNNILDDFSIFLGGGYNVNEERAYYFVKSKISKYYPVFSINSEKRGRATVNLTDADTFAIQQFEEINVGADISLPYTWVSGNYFKNIQLGLGYDYRILQNMIIRDATLPDDRVSTSHLFFLFSSLRRRAYQNVRPRMGVTFSGRYTSNLSQSGESKFIGTSRFYLPGLDYNHSLRLTASYQNEKASNSYQLPDYFGYPRGYNATLNDEVYKLGVDYMFPVLYPDIGLWGIAYFKRLRLNLFYDIGQFKYNETNFKDNFQSIGTDVYFDLTYYNLIPTSVILRYAYRMSPNVFNPETGGRFQVFYSINF